MGQEYECLTAPTRKNPVDPDKAKESVEKSDPAKPAAPPPKSDAVTPPTIPRETGGPKGREPTRYQDWERGGRCIDF